MLKYAVHTSAYLITDLYNSANLHICKMHILANSYMQIHTLAKSYTTYT